MFPTMINPYWWIPNPQVLRPFGGALPRLDAGGIYVLSTNAVEVTEESVDYGINPYCYAQLPCEALVLLKVHAAAPTGGEALPVTIVVPHNGTTTLTNTGATAGTRKVAVLDSQSTQIVGSDVSSIAARLAYINKATGEIRFLEFTSGTAAPEGAATAPTT